MRFLAMLMTFVLTVGCVGEISYAAEPTSKPEIMLETVSEGDLAYVDISDNLLQKGGLLKEYESGEQDGYGEEKLPNYLAVDRNTYNSVEAFLKSAYDVYATECSLSQFHLTPAELEEIMAEVLNTNPRYFYVRGEYSYTYSGGYVTGIMPGYDYTYEQAENMIRAYDAAVREAVSGASSDWSDMEKALYINDYLTRNCEYDTTYTNYDAYDVFVSKTAVCQGYALAYLELANQLGLSAEIVTSSSLNHAWNMIKINGKYYQEDATWNDPISDRLGRAGHQYFMKSTEYYQTEADHFKEDDWVVSGGLTWTDASSKDYDGYFWNGIDVGFEYIDGYWYGFDGEDRIVKYDCNGSALQEVEELLQIDDVWRVTGSSSYYGSKYLGLGQFDGKLYYSNPYTIYHYNLNTKTTKEVYSLSETEKTVGSIYAMHITPAGEVYYYLTPSLNTTGNVYLADVLIKGEIEPEVYTITYELDGGENHSDNPASYTENDSFVFEMPTKENYVFDGWYTDAEYTDPIVGISAGTTGNMVVYAKWVERTYDIRFDGNGSTDGQMSDMEGCLFEQNYKLSINTYEREGYSFKGWNTCADGSGVFYGDEETVRDLASFHGELVTLYAQWTPCTHNYTSAITPATTGKNGSITDTCKICGESSTRVIYMPKTLSLSQNTYTYTGKACVPTVTVKNSKGQALALGSYMVSYSNNTKVGTAKVTVTFNGKYYKGTLTKTFQIKECSHSNTSKITPATTSKNGSITDTCKKCGNKSSRAIYMPKTVILSQNTYTYTGKACVPTITVKNSKGQALALGSYTVNYSNNTKVGTAKVTVTFNGKYYKGTLTKTFKIKECPHSSNTSKITPATTGKNGKLIETCKKCGKKRTSVIYRPTTVILSKNTYTYTGKACKPTVKVKNSKGKELALGSYTVTYSNNTKVGTAKVTVRFNGKYYKGTLAKTFKIKECPHNSNTSKITPATTAKNGKITETCKNCGKKKTSVIYKPTTIKLSKNTYKYTGKACKPTVTVKNSKGKKLTLGSYTVTYSNNIKVGTAKVTVKFNGKYYKGTLTKTFRITK